MSKIIKVGCAIPTEGHTQPEALDSLLLMSIWMGKLETESKILSELAGVYSPEFYKGWELREELAKNGVRFEFYWMAAGRLFTPFAREILADNAMNHGMDYLFFVDDDMIVPQDIFYRLWRHNKDIVAALAFTRNPPHEPVLYTTHEGFEKGREYFITNSVKNYPKDKLVRVDAVGFGCVLIKTEVFKKVAKPWFMSTSPTGEDILFCVNAGKAGVKIYSDTSLKIGHIGKPEIITETTFEKYHPKESLDKQAAHTKYIEPVERLA